MLFISLRIAYLCMCGWAIVAFLRPTAGIPPRIDAHPFVAFVLALVISQTVVLVDMLIRKKRIEIISSIYFGLVIGALLAYLLVQAFDPVMEQMVSTNLIRGITSQIIKLFLMLAIPYVCTSFLLQTKDDFRFVIPYVEFSRDLKGNRPLVIDSSAPHRRPDRRPRRDAGHRLAARRAAVRAPRSSGRCRQRRQDASDAWPPGTGGAWQAAEQSSRGRPRPRNGRGERQGLSVDQRLVELAKRIGGRVVTNDFNLNKVASVQGVEVINLNDVANALKPRYLPGERLRIRILKEGEAAGQGIGYLDDGTMVVCEQASHLIGQDIDIIVTSMLQSSAGRMIFGRQVHHTSK